MKWYKRDCNVKFRVGESERRVVEWKVKIYREGRKGDRLGRDEDSVGRENFRVGDRVVMKEDILGRK